MLVVLEFSWISSLVPEVGCSCDAGGSLAPWIQIMGLSSMYSLLRGNKYGVPGLLGGARGKL